MSCEVGTGSSYDRGRLIDHYFVTAHDITALTGMKSTFTTRAVLRTEKEAPREWW